MYFRDFLQEKEENHGVLAFGRMNPPTTGHEKLVKKVKDVAKEVNGSHHVVLSHSQDKKKNPLSAEQKLKHAKRFFPNTNLSAADKDSPTILHHAARLHRAGVTHLHVVGGSDRTEEYHNLLHKYNGVKSAHGHYKFKKITVHSSGERDPVAEGTEGMSASKMRKHASEGNYKEFKKGVPSHVSDEHSKELYRDVRHGMGIHESLNIDSSFETMLNEGVHDHGIFKAVFLAGGPGSGKDYIMNNTLDGHGLTEINSDKALEYLMDKHKLSKKMPKSQQEKRDIVRGRAKNMTELRQRLAIEGRNGLIINGTGDDIEKTKKIKKELEKLGYESKMLMVHTADEVSKKRNIERGKRGGRTVPENIRSEKWKGVQKNRPEFAKLFGQHYHEFDNSYDSQTAHPNVRKAKTEEMGNLWNTMHDFVGKPTDNEKSGKWIAHELQQKDTQKIPRKGAEKTPHPESKAAQEASEKGLKYYGNGRFGTKGKITHRSVQDKLIEVPKEVEKAPKVPLQASSSGHTTPTPLTTKQKQKLKKIQKQSKLPKDIKKVNEEFESFLNEAISITISGDTPDEIRSAIKLLKNTESDVDESYTLAGHDAMNVLTLGKGLMKEEDEYLKDSKGNLRIFHLRASAAKEAHQKSGTVVSHPKGYIVKTKENKNVQENLGLFDKTDNDETRSSIASSRTDSRAIYSEGSSSSARSASADGCSSGSTSGSGKTRKKITLKEIREKQKAMSESIDFGTEPGLSMAGAGESPARDTGEKIDKKKFGKASQVAETIGAGGEDALSMSDFNQETLKQKSINLKTFKSKKFVG